MKKIKENDDLVWCVEQFKSQQEALHLLKKFAGVMCLFSKSLNRLYAKYEIKRVSLGRNGVVTYPDSEAYTDTVYDIPKDAVVPTPLLIAATKDKNGKSLKICYKSEQEGIWKSMPLKSGLLKFKYLYGKDDPLLPVIVNSGLKKAQGDEMPLMQVHRVSIKKLKSLSRFQINDIQNAVYSKISFSDAS